MEITFQKGQKTVTVNAKLYFALKKQRKLIHKLRTAFRAMAIRQRDEQAFAE